MPELIACPSCQRSLRVPDEMIGRPVKCPDCGMVFFTVPSSPSTGPATAEPILPTSYASPGYAESAAARGMLTAPAIFLLILGCLGFFLAFQSLVTALRTQEKDIQAMVQGTKFATQEQEQGATMVLRFMYGPGGIAFHSVFMGFNFIIMLGGMAMLARRFYGLAVLAGILSIINFDSCCCAAGVPLGMWSLSVLMRQEVREAFR